MPGPLDGVRVLDLTTMVSGPVATMMLADQGADVVKIESPAGDLMRNYGVIQNGMSSSFLSCNRGKKSLCIDIKTPEGLEIVKKLIPTADVLVQNFRPGAIARMGLGEEVVRKLNPKIVFVSISGVGETGPYAHQRVYDPVIQALCGLAEIQADRHSTGKPRMVRTIIPDKTTAVTAAQAITAGLYAQLRTGQGQHIRLAMLDVMIGYLWPEAISSLTYVGNETDPASGQMGLDLVFKTQDRHITAGALSDAEWAGMCRALKRDDLINDPRFDSVAARGKNVVDRRRIVSEELEKWASDEILKRLNDEGVPCAPILSRTELLDDLQVKENGTLQIFQNDRIGEVRQPKPAAQFDQTPVGIARLAPYLGEDNEGLLEELGYTSTEISDLSAANIVQARS